MGILNQASDGLPSILIALLRAMRHFGPLPRAELLARCCPPALQQITSSKLGSATLTRWTQLGLFQDDADLVRLHPDTPAMPTERVAELAAISKLLRRILLAPANNLEINTPEPALAGDFTLGLSWALAQDVFALPGGVHREVEKHMLPQFSESPIAFQNDTRWNGFRAWAPVLGFGWTEAVGGSPLLVVDPTDAVRDELPDLFSRNPELPIGDFLARLAERVPVLDGGMYRRAVEERLAPASWRATASHEVSISLSAALVRLDRAGAIRLTSRGDAPKKTLLGRSHRNMEQVSHIESGERCDA